jgi:hypothetical protein
MIAWMPLVAVAAVLAVLLLAFTSIRTLPVGAHIPRAVASRSIKGTRLTAAILRAFGCVHEPAGGLGATVAAFGRDGFYGRRCDFWRALWRVFPVRHAISACRRLCHADFCRSAIRFGWRGGTSTRAPFGLLGRFDDCWI